MFKNYLIAAIRTILKKKAFSVINILGLSIGVSAALLIFLLANYHYGFDKFEKDRSRIYRVVSSFNFSGSVEENPGVCVPLADAMRSELTGIESIVSFRIWDGDPWISINPGNNQAPVVYKHQKDIVFADMDYFRLVPYEWLAGSPTISLSSPRQVILTLSKAAVLFQGLSASAVIGRQININDTIALTVGGVVKDISANSDFTFKTFVSYSTLTTAALKPGNWEQWDNTTYVQQLFIKLSPGTAAPKIETAISRLCNKYISRHGQGRNNTVHFLQPLENLHFNAAYGAYGNPVASKPAIYGLLAVALFLLLLGCVNFVNLTTAQANRRAKEIGIRKTLGSSRKQLVLQFLFETFFLTLSATIIAIALLPLLLKAFAAFLPQDLHFGLVVRPEILLLLVLLILAVTVLSGFYPALILSGFKPVSLMKNQASAGTSRNEWVRKLLIVSQFFIAQVLTTSTIIVARQISYALNKDLGFKKEAIVYFNIDWTDTANGKKIVLLEKAKHIPAVRAATLCSIPPSSVYSVSSPIGYFNGNTMLKIDAEQKYGDPDYINVYGLRLLAGNNLQRSDTIRSVLVNETYAHLLGFQKPSEAVGKFLQWNDKQIPIRGIVADFNQSSLHKPVSPLLITNWPTVEYNISIALNPQRPGKASWKDAIAQIKTIYNELYPQSEFIYNFFDEDIAKYYNAERQLSAILFWATGIAIFISCLGLLGLVTHTTTQRVKEIGVRKILGASPVAILYLITKSFLILVILAFFLATPLVWIIMHKWLQNFAYHTDIDPWLFFAGGLLMTMMALLTLSYQTIRAAMANPAKSLRID